MKHASDTNRQDRAQKLARREKHSSNQGDRLVFEKRRKTTVDFSHLSEDEIQHHREQISKEMTRRKRFNMIFGSLLVIVVFGGLYWAWRKLVG